MDDRLTSWVTLHGVQIALVADNSAIHARWATIFAGFQSHAERPADLTLILTLVEQLPPLPEAVSRRTLAPAGQRPITVYTQADGTQHVELPDLARLRLSGNTVLLTIAQRAVETNQLEDVTLIALAPLLRRHGLFMVHAFGAVHAGRAVLLVGRSGSGKTTSGLNLLLNGWHYLANDVVLLRRSDDGVEALAGPGALGITAQTLALLPALTARLGAPPPLPHGEKWIVSADRLASPAAPARVALIAFPAVGRDDVSAAQPVPTGVALARLMEQSVDSWDGATLPAHVDLLQQLVGQARAVDLSLGRDFAAQAARLAAILAQ